MTPVIEILVVGNEILSGRTQDRNAVHIVESLMKEGFPVSYISIVGDTEPDLTGAFQTAVKRADIVLASGGLGPTSDDITVQALAEAFGCQLILDEEVLSNITDLFRRRDRFMSESNKKQAYLPSGAVALENTLGTAPGILFERNGCSVYLMPGVPKELQTMFDLTVLPHIIDSHEPLKTETASVKVSGISESELYDRIVHLPGAVKAFSYYPGFDGIEIKISTCEDAPMDASLLRDEIVNILGNLVYSSQGESLEQIIGKMLIESGTTIGVAESCTGGLIANRLTNTPGSSAYMLAGVVAYSNDSKHEILGVDTSLIESHGAVSAEVAEAMARGIRKITGAQIGLSTTGIAGPGGGSPEKPVGLMYTGISSNQGNQTKKLQFVEDRLINKGRMSQAVLDLLRLHLKKRLATL